jgi:hypothetical protein
MSTQHLDETLEPLNWIRVCPYSHDEHSHKRSHVLYYVSCNISKYTTFKPHTRPSFLIFIPSNSSHLTKNINLQFDSQISSNLVKRLCYSSCVIFFNSIHLLVPNTCKTTILNILSTKLLLFFYANQANNWSAASRLE